MPLRIAIDARLATSTMPSGTVHYANGLIAALSAVDKVNEYVLMYGDGDAHLLRDAVGDSTSFVTRRIRPGGRLLRLLWVSLQWPRIDGIVDQAQIIHALTIDYVPSSIKTYIATVHDVLFLRYPQFFPRRNQVLHRRNLELTLRHATLVLAVSQNTARELNEFTAFPKERIVVVPLAPDPVFSPDAAYDDQATLDRVGLDQPFFIFAGTFEPRKNLQRLVRAFRDARLQSGKRFKLLVVGHPGWLADGIMADLAASEAQGDVLVRGSVTKRELAALMRRAVACVCPSLGEGFGLPVLEAMASGTPVITSKYGSLAEIAGDAALLIDPLDTDRIAEGIVTLAGDSALRAELRGRGLLRSAQFSWNLTAQRTIAAYEMSQLLDRVD